jgi:hypothetical protein
VTFRLTDFATHKTRAEEMKSRPLDEIRPGGLGCHLINEIMDEVKLVDCNCGNILQMKKCLRAKGPKRVVAKAQSSKRTVVPNSQKKTGEGN